MWTLLSQWDTLREGPATGLPARRAHAHEQRPGGRGLAGVRGPRRAHTPVSACASQAPEAIGFGLEMIRSSRADVVICGGTEAAVHPLPIAGFAAMQALSTRNDAPELASRPYDTGRDGFVLGEVPPW